MPFTVVLIYSTPHRTNYLRNTWLWLSHHIGIAKLSVKDTCKAHRWHTHLVRGLPTLHNTHYFSAANGPLRCSLKCPNTLVGVEHIDIWNVFVHVGERQAVPGDPLVEEPQPPAPRGPAVGGHQAAHRRPDQRGAPGGQSPKIMGFQDNGALAGPSASGHSGKWTHIKTTYECSIWTRTNPTSLPTSIGAIRLDLTWWGGGECALSQIFWAWRLCPKHQTNADTCHGALHLRHAKTWSHTGGVPQQLREPSNWGLKQVRQWGWKKGGWNVSNGRQIVKKREALHRQKQAKVNHYEVFENHAKLCEMMQKDATLNNISEKLKSANFSKSNFITCIWLWEMGMNFVISADLR